MRRFRFLSSATVRAGKICRAKALYFINGTIHTEAKEMGNNNISIATIMGLDENEVDMCQICQQKLFDLRCGNGAMLADSTDLHEIQANEMLNTCLIIRHRGPGYLKAHTIEC